MPTDDAPLMTGGVARRMPGDAIALRPIPGSLRVMRGHVMEPRWFVEALDAPALWDFVDGGDGAAEVLKARGDRAVFVARIPMPPMASGSGPVLDGAGGDGAGVELSLVVKVFRVRGPRDVVWRLLGRSRAQREWLGLWRLRDAGVCAAMPYVLLRGRVEDGGGVELLVMERVAGRDLLRMWAEGGLDGEAGRAILDRVGAQVAGLMRATTPLFNRDHKASNIVIDPGGVPVVIDAAGVRAWRFQRPVAMLAKLWIEVLGARGLHPELSLPSRVQRWRVVRAYCRDALGGWGLATPVSRRAQAKSAWRAAARMVERHGDPVPADDPLG